MSSEKVTINAPPRVAPTPPVATRPADDARKVALQRIAQEKPAVAPTAETVKAVAHRIETYLKSVNRSLEFRVDAASGRTVVSVRDSETGDLIRQIPGDEVLRFAEMAEDQTIVLLNESA